MKKIKALIDYKDLKINKDVKKGDDIIELYKKANIELTDERIQILLKVNGQPFIEVEENDVDIIETEEADIKPKRSKKIKNK